MTKKKQNTMTLVFFLFCFASFHLLELISETMIVAKILSSLSVNVFQGYGASGITAIRNIGAGLGAWRRLAGWGRLWEACWYLRLFSQFIFVFLSTLALVRPFGARPFGPVDHRSVYLSVRLSICPFVCSAVDASVGPCVAWGLGFGSGSEGVKVWGLVWGLLVCGSGLGSGVGVWGPCWGLVSRI